MSVPNGSIAPPAVDPRIDPLVEDMQELQKAVLPTTPRSGSVRSYAPATTNSQRSTIDTSTGPIKLREHRKDVFHIRVEDDMLLTKDNIKVWMGQIATKHGYDAEKFDIFGKRSDSQFKIVIMDGCAWGQRPEEVAKAIHENYARPDSYNGPWKKQKVEHEDGPIMFSIQLGEHPITQLKSRAINFVFKQNKAGTNDPILQAKLEKQKASHVSFGPSQKIVGIAYQPQEHKVKLIWTKFSESILEKLNVTKEGVEAAVRENNPKWLL